ncbi:hypothetical protein NLU13_1915 [Sarocladium strictum]|uniref:DUF7704 domain-containing protein n=1 Tax=Sarocladium strictum TaxID=5046 RepID=A0AA39LCT5_SARSR|nr:hypothetical protein NLU13_1915 [Sarocladium strictum]
MAPRTSIPLLYRLSLLYFEPVFALSGAFILYFCPATFFTTMTPSPPPTGALASVRVLTDQLAAMQILLAFNTGIVLRFAVAGDDRRRETRLWRVCCAGMLICDVLHIMASARELGWEILVEPARWRGEDWANVGILGWMAAVRLGVVLGIGMGEEKRGSGKEENGRFVGRKSPKGANL